MGKRYLIDSNVIIDFCNGKLPETSKQFLIQIDPEISIITNIELFATKNIPEKEYTLIERFIDLTTIHPVSTDLVKMTIDIRRSTSIKLPDAIIAATAIVHQLPLISRNKADFRKVEDLQIIDPYNM
jgi:predicted nucleic acid-binding protein